MFFKKIKDFLRNIKQGISNLINWFPIVWKDRQWDHTFIYKVLRHKLHMTEQYIRHYGIHVNNEKDADKIRTCVLLLDRLIEDIHFDMAFKKFHKKWGEATWSLEPTEGEPEYSELHISYPNVKDEKDEKFNTKEFKRACEHEDMLRKQDVEYLFKFMRKHIQTWWD